MHTKYGSRYIVHKALILLVLHYALFSFRINTRCRHTYSTPRAVVTPVRRSTRRSVVNLPSMLKDHDRIVESLSHLSIDEKKRTLFMPNIALEDTLNTTGTAL